MQPVSNAGLCSRPWISLPAGLWSVFTAFTEPEIQQQHDRSLVNPTHQAKALEASIIMPGLDLLIFVSAPDVETALCTFVYLKWNVLYFNTSHSNGWRVNCQWYQHNVFIALKWWSKMIMGFVHEYTYQNYEYRIRTMITSLHSAHAIHWGSQFSCSKLHTRLL